MPRRIVDRISWIPNLGHAYELSPDGKTMVFLVDGQVHRSLVHLYRWGEIEWSPNGRFIGAFGYPREADYPNHPSLFVVTFSEGEPRRLTAPVENYKEALVWHPAGDRLTFVDYGDPATNDSQVRVVSLDDPPLVSALIDQPEHWDYYGVWAPNGKHFYFASFGSGPRGLHLYDVEARKVTHHELNIDTLPLWSRNGAVVTWTLQKELKRLVLLEVSGR